MKFQILLYVLGVCSLITNTELHAQKTLPSTFPDGEFIILQDSTLLMLGEFTLKRRFGMFRFFDSNGKRIEETRIRYTYLSDRFKGYYNGTPLSLNSTGFYNFFSGSTYSGTPQSGGTVKNIDYYFARSDYGELQRVSYLSLKEELLLNHGQIDQNDLDEVMGLVYTGKKKRSLALQLIGIGLGTVAAGAIWRSGAEDISQFRKTASFGTAILGLGILIGGVSVGSADEYYNEALMRYNKSYSSK